MTGRAIKDTLFVPLSVDALRDERLNAASMVAQLIYFRGLLQAKAAARDGIVTRRAVIGSLFETPVAPRGDGPDALSHEVVSRGIDELVALGLWAVVDPDLGTYRVTGWLKHNEAVEAVEHRRREAEEAHRRGGHMTNHKKGLHRQPVAGCPDCPDVSHGVSPGQSASSARAHAERSGSGPVPSGASAAVATASETESEVEVENTTKPPLSTQEGISTGSGGGGVEAAEVVMAAIDQLGLAAPAPASTQELRYVDRALDQGWTADDLIAPAVEASGRTDIGRPRPWVVGAWKRMANTDPAATCGDSSRPVAPAVGLRRAHPEDCPGRCSAEGWVDGPGGLSKCQGQPVEANA